MKALLNIAAALAVASTCYGQGQFTFNTHNPTAGNDVRFAFNGKLADATTPDLFVEVFAGPDVAHLQPLGALPLNRTGAEAGYTNPYSATYTVSGMPGGTLAVVGYQPFQGTSFATATVVCGLILSVPSVLLQEVPSDPNEVVLGNHVADPFCPFPEPPTGFLSGIGLATVLLFGHKRSRNRGQMNRSNRCAEPGDSAPVPTRASATPGR